MNWQNIDPEAWLLLCKWVADIMNHTSEESLGGRIPMSILTGETIDISIFLVFLFWDVVYVLGVKGLITVDKLEARSQMRSAEDLLVSQRM
jgi:hypothetical protein